MARTAIRIRLLGETDRYIIGSRSLEKTRTILRFVSWLKTDRYLERSHESAAWRRSSSRSLLFASFFFTPLSGVGRCAVSHVVPFFHRTK